MEVGVRVGLVDLSLAAGFRGVEGFVHQWEIMNRTLMWSGLRPKAAAFARMSSRNDFIAAMLPAEAMIVSAQRAAKVRPRAEPPA